MKLIDLTRTLDPTDLSRLPAPVRPFASVLVPEVDYLAPAEGGRERMCTIFGCDAQDLPDGEGWGEETFRMSSHAGTHVDAPLHYGSTCEGQTARTITDIAIEELFCDGFVLDLRGRCKPGDGISVDTLEEALRAVGGSVPPGSASFSGRVRRRSISRTSGATTIPA